MPTKVGPEQLDVKIRFGGGLHTRASEDEIDEREAAGGRNFVLDPGNGDLRNRKPFDLIATVTDPSGGGSGSILGGGSLLKADGTVSTLIQRGTVAYEWTGGTTFEEVATGLNASTKLRGHWRSHNWTLADKVLLTDLGLVETVKEWNGTVFQAVTFTDETGSGLFGNFYAKYLSIENERAVFSNTRDVGTTPHLIVGSKRGDYTNITVANRPSSSLSEEDPFFLLAPDLRPINGHVEAFGSTLISSEKGRMFNLSGSSAKDFSFEDFYAGSAAAGDESLAYIGNDVVYGRLGRIESVTDTERFGDSESDDLTVPIADQVEDYSGWTIVYNSRLNRVYAFPTGQSEVWVFETAMLRKERSPWMRWTTQHALAFQPSFVASMLDPDDGLEYVFMGDTSGNLYRLEGTGSSGDGGSANIRMEWLTRLYSAPLDAKEYVVEGYVKYRKGGAANVQLQFEYSGESVYNETISIDIPQTSATTWYGNSQYYSDGEYYGVAFVERLTRQRIEVPGTSNEFQVRVITEGTVDIKINEIGLRFRAAS